MLDWRHFKSKLKPYKVDTLGRYKNKTGHKDFISHNFFRYRMLQRLQRCIILKTRCSPTQRTSQLTHPGRALAFSFTKPLRSYGRPRFQAIHAKLETQMGFLTTGFCKGVSCGVWPSTGTFKIIEYFVIFGQSSTNLWWC